MMTKGYLPGAGFARKTGRSISFAAGRPSFATKDFFIPAGRRQVNPFRDDRFFLKTTEDESDRSA
jgi:hypothetical protein